MGNSSKGKANVMIDNIKSGENSKFKWVTIEAKCSRDQMEDAYIIKDSLSYNNKDMFISGIFDGHGGGLISKFAAGNVNHILNEVLNKINDKDNEILNVDDPIMNSLVKSFIKIDQMLKSEEVNEFLINLKDHYKYLEGNEENFNYFHYIKNKGDNSLYKKIFEEVSSNYHSTNSTSSLNSYEDMYNSNNTIENKNNSKSNNINNNDLYESESINKDNNNETLYDYSNFLEGKSSNDSNKNCNFNKTSDFTHDTSRKPENSSYIIKYFKSSYSSLIRNRIFFSSNSITNFVESSLIAKNMGSTGNVVCIYNDYIYCANIGDSLSILYKNNAAIKLNNLHRLSLISERKRIIKAGGIKIINDRLNGRLNLTRSFGDFSYKNERLKVYEQAVTCYPEVTKQKISSEVEFVLMGCDGIWDYINYNETSKYISHNLKNSNKTLHEIIISIFNMVVDNKKNDDVCFDNITFTIIVFKHS